MFIHSIVTPDAQTFIFSVWQYAEMHIYSAL